MTIKQTTGLVFSGACFGQLCLLAGSGDWKPLVSVALVMQLYFAIVGIVRVTKP